MKMYSTEVTTIGGRSGRAQSTDGRLEVDLSVPRELGGDGGPGTNPEQLFAAGYSACFDSALRLVARLRKITLPEGSAITAKVGLDRTDAGSYVLDAQLTGRFPGLPRATAIALMHAAHEVCPYSNATRGNLSVELGIDEAAASAAA